MMVTMGGDHFITYPLLKLMQKYGPLSLIHFDAHCDTWPDDGNRLDHGSMFLRAVNEEIVDPSTSVQIVLELTMMTLSVLLFWELHGFTGKESLL